MPGAQCQQKEKEYRLVRRSSSRKPLKVADLSMQSTNKDGQTKEQVHRILQINLELVLLQDRGGPRPSDGCNIAIIITLQFESVRTD